MVHTHRRYQDSQGEWKSSYHYTKNQPANVLKVAQQFLEPIEMYEPAPAEEKQAA